MGAAGSGGSAEHANQEKTRLQALVDKYNADSTNETSAVITALKLVPDGAEKNRKRTQECADLAAIT